MLNIAVKDNAKIILSPTDPLLGANASFYCKWSDKNTKFFFNGNKLPPNSYTLRTLYYDQLLIVNVSYENYGKYQCYGWDNLKKVYFIAEDTLKVHG